MTLTVPPTSEDTHSSEPSALEFGEARTRIDQHVGDDLLVSVSMKCAMLVVSEVLTRILAVRADRHAFRLDADRHFADGTRFAMSMMVTVLSFSLAT